jgi:Domain of unknown function (DUF4277)/Transposase DDE domain
MAAFNWASTVHNVECVNLGPLALVLPLLERLDVAGILDRLLPPPDPQQDFSHGQVLQALLAARLCRPSALVNVESWAEEVGYEYVGGIRADKLNDDRLGRSLDAFFDIRHSAMADVTHQTLRLAERSLHRLHFDPTVVTLTGAYDTSQPRPDPLVGEPPIPSDAALKPAQINHHHSTDDRAVQIGQTAVVDDLGAVPVFAHLLDGSRNHHPGVQETFELLRKHVPLPARMRLLSDRGTFSIEHLARLHGHDYEAVCAANWNDYRALYDLHADQLDWHEASYLSQEQRRRRQTSSALPQEHYELAERPHTVVNPLTGKDLDLRLIFVYSTAAERECGQRRQEQIAKLQSGLAELQARLARGHAQCTDQTIRTQVVRLLDQKAAARYFTWQIVPLTEAEQAALPKPGKGHRRARHRLEYHFDAAAAQAGERYDGLSVLVTTAAAEASADQLFTEYKQQAYVELLHHQAKTPLAVSPIFLKTPERVEALVCLLQLALQAYQLLERLYRQATPREAPPSEKRMTAERLLRAFACCGVIVQSTAIGDVVETTRLNTRQRDILERLGLPTPREFLAQRLPPVPADATG